MGNILVDSNGNALLSGGNALEVTSAIDSNIQAGNIKKDVTILGVTGTYEGSGAGGFSCINKLIVNNDSEIQLDDTGILHTYRFNGQLADCALALYSSNNDSLFQIKNTSDSSFTWDGMTVTPGEIIFKDKFNYQYNYNILSSKELVASKTLHFTGTDLDITLSINNNGELSVINPYVGDSNLGNLPICVIFKGTDGTYDFDMFRPRYEIYD